MQNGVPYTAIWDFKSLGVAKGPGRHFFVDLRVGRLHRMVARIHEINSYLSRTIAQHQDRSGYVKRSAS
jgi:hypothetical protein